MSEALTAGIMGLYCLVMLRAFRREETVTGLAETAIGAIILLWILAVVLTFVLEMFGVIGIAVVAGIAAMAMLIKR